MKSSYISLLLVSITLVIPFSPALSKQNHDPLKPVKEADQLDLIFSSFSQSFEIIKPQIDEWAKCDAASLFANDSYRSQLIELSSKLRNNVLTLLPTVDDNVKLYQLDIEYNRSFWAHKGYFEGLATAMDVSIEQIADEQAKNCISEND